MRNTSNSFLDVYASYDMIKPKKLDMLIKFANTHV